MDQYPEGDRRIHLLQDEESDFEEESEEARNRRYRNSSMGEVSDPEHWMRINHFSDGEEEEEIAIDSPTEGRRAEGGHENEPPTTRRRIADEPEPEDQEELPLPEQEIADNGIRVLDYDGLARPGETYIYRFAGGTLELRYRQRGEGHEQEDERVRRVLEPLSRRLGIDSRTT